MLDLQGENGMDSIVGMLYGMVDHNYRRLISIVRGSSQEEVDYKGLDQRSNSIGQLLKHLAYVDLNWVYRIKTEPVPFQLEKEYGPALDPSGHLPKFEGFRLMNG